MGRMRLRAPDTRVPGGCQAPAMFPGRVWILLSATAIFHPKLAHFELKYVKIVQHFNQRENPCKGTGPGDPRGEDRRGSVLDPASPMLWVLESLGCRLSSSQRFRDMPSTVEGGRAGTSSACLSSKPVTSRGGQPGTDPARREGRTCPAPTEPAAPRARADPRWPSPSVSPWPGNSSAADATTAPLTVQEWSWVGQRGPPVTPRLTPTYPWRGPPS